jgi:NAD(P)-dependent dehydrogenase (short-subunit alcohol dehydrogenase family)
VAENCLSLDAFNAIIVGDGAIGSALLDNLLERPGLQRALILGRRAKSAPADDRVVRLRFDATNPESIASAAGMAQQSFTRAHLLINTVGLLHNQTLKPEKRLRDINSENLKDSFMVNATLLPMLAQAFEQMLHHDEPALLASLSARVGSIEDNQMGGWYSYRASKAAHNMLLKTLACEWRVSHSNTVVVALHPGTVRSPLSEPFLTPGYKNRVLTPQECAEKLLGVISTLHVENSGSFFDWQGKSIPW